MKSNYKRIGGYIRPLNVKNTDLKAKELLGINIDKFFMPSVANVVGTDLSKYKVVEKNQFACNRMHVGRDYRIPISCSDKNEPFMVSPAYDVFEIKDTKVLNPEFLMMWFSRKEFDRNAWYYTDADVRGGLPWKSFCDMQLPIPHPDKQREIVKEYNTIQNRINLNQQLIQKLEETAQSIYKQWFVEFEFPDENGKPYKSNGGEMVWNEELEKEIPNGWEVGSLTDVVNSKYPITYGVVQPGDEDENGVKFIRSGDLKNGEILFSQLRTISEEVSNQFKRTKLEGGEILISIVGNPGQVAIVPFFLKGANIARQVAMVKVENVDFQLFIKNQLVSEEGQKALKNITIGSVQDVINLEDLRLLKIIIPDSKILNYFNKLSKTLEVSLQQKFLEIQKLIELKELLLSKLATVV